jgi:TolB protein
MRHPPVVACLAFLVLGCTDAQAPVPDPRLQDVILFLSDRNGGQQMHLMAPRGGAIAPLYPDTNLPGSGVIYTRPAISPDGRWIAFTMLGDVWVARADGMDLRNLTQTPGEDGYPAWSPDGAQIAFASDRDGDDEIFVVNVDGTALLQVTNDPGDDNGPAWTPDGARIGFSSDRGGDFDIYVVTLIGGSLANLTQTPGSDYLPAWSHNGQTVAFGSTRDGGNFLYLMDADGGNVRPLVLGVNAGFPAWGPGDSLIAFDRGGDIWIVRPDGTGLINLTNDGPLDGNPAWAR